MSWFYMRDGERQGPVPLEHLASWLHAGHISVDDLVWTDGMPEWQPIAAVSAIAGAPNPLPAPPQASSSSSQLNDRTLRAIVPIGRSPWAIASGYLGLFSVFPVVGLLAMGTGVIGIWHLQQREDLSGLPRCFVGIALGLVTSVFWFSVFQSPAS